MSPKLAVLPWLLCLSLCLWHLLVSVLQLLVTRLCLQCPFSPSRLYVLHLHYTLKSLVLIISPDFPLSLKLSPFPFSLNLSETIPLKVRLLRIQRLSP